MVFVSIARDRVKARLVCGVHKHVCKQLVQKCRARAYYYSTRFDLITVLITRRIQFIQFRHPNSCLLLVLGILIKAYLNNSDILPPRTQDFVDLIAQ